MINYLQKRSAPRYRLEVPVVLDEGTGVTRDISSSGIYLKTRELLVPGDCVRFSFVLEFVVPDGPLHFNCKGRVLRVEKIGDEYGVASTIDEMNSLH